MMKNSTYIITAFLIVLWGAEPALAKKKAKSKPAAVCRYTDGALVLSGGQAKRSGTISERKDILSKWSAGGSAEWSFLLDEPVSDETLWLEYGCDEPCRLDYTVNGRPFSVPLARTPGGGKIALMPVTKISLPAGTHTLKLLNKDQASFITLKRVEITAKDILTSSDEYPRLYAKKVSWAETMVAMRQKFARLQGMDKKYLNQRDGKALWTDFARESDWFLQDNQVHGNWGRGYYDARQDYKNYLDPNRDNTLEQKLIEQALAELGDAATPMADVLRHLISKKCSPDDPAWLELYEKACIERRRIRLAPLLNKTERLIYTTHMNMGMIYLNTETQSCADGSQIRVIDLAPEREGARLKDELLFDSNNGIVRDPELSFDGKKMLFAWRKTNRKADSQYHVAPPTGNYKIYEMTLADRSIRPLTNDETYGADFEPCYLPNGDIMFSSVRCVQQITCGGGGDCSNLFIMNKDGKYARRVGYDQTQTGFPHLLNDGRVIYTRRDYNDRGQSYAHALFVMNPDGTRQTEYYGNNSLVPTSIQHTRAIPGSSKTMGIAGGYHTSQGGKLLIIDPRKGTQNYDGLTFYNWEPTPPEKVNNENYSRKGEQYSYPFPLDENSCIVSLSPVGAYMTTSNGFVNTAKEEGNMRYKLYYMTLDGRRELLASHPELSCAQGIPVMARKAPQARPSSTDYTKDKGVCYVQNVYYGPSAEGVEPGSVKKLRIVQIHYKPAGVGVSRWGPPRDEVGVGKKYAGYGVKSYLPVGLGGVSFDAKQILGEVDVHPDGSAMFEVPAKTPIYFQLLDKNGLVIQTMRSWTTLMPNERFSCVGCHEENDSAPLSDSSRTMAMQRAPQQIQPSHDISGQPFSYAKMVQPIFDQHCISCHAPGKKAAAINLTDKRVGSFGYYISYCTLLQKDSKTLGNGPARPNEWVDFFTYMATTELTPPYYSGAVKSGLIKMLLKGHGKTKLTPDEIETVAAWIDLNVPFIGAYDELNKWKPAECAFFTAKTELRNKQEEIERKNIQEFIQDGQP